MSRCFRGNRGFCCPRHRSKAVVHSEDHGFDLACWQVRSMTTAVNLRLYNSSTSANARNRETCRPIGDQRGYCGVCPPMQFRKTEDDQVPYLIIAHDHHRVPRAQNCWCPVLSSAKVITARLSARYRE